MVQTGELAEVLEDINIFISTQMGAFLFISNDYVINGLLDERIALCNHSKNYQFLKDDNDFFGVI